MLIVSNLNICEEYTEDIVEMSKRILDEATINGERLTGLNFWGFCGFKNTVKVFPWILGYS